MRRAVKGLAVVAGMVPGVFACGREPTGLHGADRMGVVARLVDQQQMPTVSVSAAAIHLYVVTPSGRSQLVTSSLSPTEAAKIGVSSTEITVTLSFPWQGIGATYEVDGEALSLLGVKLFALGPARFTDSDMRAPGGAHVTLMVAYVGPAIIPPVIPPIDSIPLPIPPLPLPIPTDTAKVPIPPLPLPIPLPDTVSVPLPLPLPIPPPTDTAKVPLPLPPLPVPLPDTVSVPLPVPLPNPLPNPIPPLPVPNPLPLPLPVPGIPVVGGKP